MNVRMVVLGTLAGAGLFVAGFTVAQGPPEQDIDPQIHPALSAAQNLVAQSYRRLLEAQRANDWDMNGHAAKAEDLLVRASHEMKAAALAANRHR